MDPDPAEIHHHEQLGAAVRDCAFCVWTYHTELIRLGMPEETARTLTLAYQAAFITGPIEDEE